MYDVKYHAQYLSIQFLSLGQKHIPDNWRRVRIKWNTLIRLYNYNFYEFWFVLDYSYIKIINHIWSICSTESLPNFKMNNPSLDPRARPEPGQQCRLSWLDRRHQNARDVCDQRRLLWPSLLPLFRRVMHPNVPSAKSITTGSLILPTMFSTFFYWDSTRWELFII